LENSPSIEPRTGERQSAIPRMPERRQILRPMRWPQDVLAQVHAMGQRGMRRARARPIIERPARRWARGMKKIECSGNSLRPLVGVGVGSGSGEFRPPSCRSGREGADRTRMGFPGSGLAAAQYI